MFSLPFHHIQHPELQNDSILGVFPRSNSAKLEALSAKPYVHASTIPRLRLQLLRLVLLVKILKDYELLLISNGVEKNGGENGDEDVPKLIDGYVWYCSKLLHYYKEKFDFADKFLRTTFADNFCGQLLRIFIWNLRTFGDTKENPLKRKGSLQTLLKACWLKALEQLQLPQLLF